MILATKIISTALPFIAINVGARSVFGQAVGHCETGGPTGYFTGVATSHQSGRLDISLNLRCAGGRYDGELVSPLGTFVISGGRAAANRLHLGFMVGSDRGTIDASAGLDSLHGSFAIEGDSGSLALARIGKAQARGWNVTSLNLKVAQWREDLAFFARQIVQRHADPFHRLPRPRFDLLIRALDSRLDSLSGERVYVELDRIANLIGDAHTYIELPAPAPRFPFAIRRFGNDYRVIAVMQGDEQSLGAKLLKVENVPIAEVIQRLWSLTPADENTPLRQARAEGFVSSGSILHGVGITPDRDTVTLTLADDGGQEFRVKLRAASMDPATAPSKDVFAAAPLYAQHPGQPFWYQYLSKAGVVYCSFRGYDSLAAKAAGLFALLGRVRPEKLVIDLRQNSGGDYTLGLRYLIEPISRLPQINRPGHLFVAIGGNTFSAGMANAAQFRGRTHAILVGETIGEKPNSFQEPREMQLPNSRLIVRYSTRYYRFVERGPNAVRPDHQVKPTWAEYRGGHDPVLEWILRYTNAAETPDRRRR